MKSAIESECGATTRIAGIALMYSHVSAEHLMSMGSSFTTAVRLLDLDRLLPMVRIELSKESQRDRWFDELEKLELQTPLRIRFPRFLAMNAGETKKQNKPQHDNRLTRSESNFHRDYNPQPTVNARLPSGGVCALTFGNNCIGVPCTLMERSTLEKSCGLVDDIEEVFWRLLLVV